jgi:hypothetical protein
MLTSWLLLEVEAEAGSMAVAVALEAIELLQALLAVEEVLNQF